MKMKAIIFPALLLASGTAVAAEPTSRCVNKETVTAVHGKMGECVLKDAWLSIPSGSTVSYVFEEKSIQPGQSSIELRTLAASSPGGGLPAVPHLPIASVSALAGSPQGDDILKPVVVFPKDAVFLFPGTSDSPTR